MNGYDKEAELRDAMVRAIRAATREHVIIEGTILTVDETAFTASVQIGDTTDIATLYDVPLRVLIGQQASFIEIPVEGTKCIISFTDGNVGRPRIQEVHQALKILVNCDNIIFNNGTLGGLVIVQNNVDRLNKIENDINSLKNVFSGWTPVPNDGGAALKSAASTWFSQQLTPTQKTDIENTKILQ
jgi:hypothetical protein